MKKKARPVFLSLTKVKVPVTAYVSFFHRVSGVLLFGMCAFLFYMLALSLDSREGFESAKMLVHDGWPRVAFWVCVSSLAYHTLAGIRHLLMDFGFAEGLKSGKISAYVVICLFVLIVLATGKWLFL